MNKIKINIYFLLLFFTRLMAGHEEVLYWEKIVAEGVCKLDSLVEANASIGNENSAEASTTIPNYFVDLRSSKAIGISESFIKTLNEYIYNQQLIKGYKDKNYAVYVLLTDKLASVNKEDLLLYFQGLNKINQLSDVNTASVLSLKNAYENAYGKRNLGKELSVNSTVTFPSETTQNQAGKTAVVSNVFKIQESAHDLAIKRIFKLSKISSSDKLGILMGLDLDYSTLGYLINTNTTSSLKININASVAVDKRMASELATDLSSKINNKSTETTLEGKISSKTHLFLEQCKNFNTTTGVLTAELEVYLTDFETKAQNNKLESTEVYNKLTKEHLAQITEKQITRLLAITCKFKSWDSYASKVVYFILNNIPSTKAYKLYKELDTIPSGLKQKVLVYWYNQIKPAALDLESNMKGLSSSLKTLLSKIPVSVLQEEITNALSDATRSLNIDYDYPFTRCNTTNTQLKPLFKNASIDNATNTLSYEYYGIEVYPTYRKCCHEVIYKSGTPTPQCLYYDYRLRGMATTQTCSPISLFYLADYSGGAVKYYYMPAIFLANLSTDAFQAIKENIAWLGVELAVTLVTWPVGGEPGLALYLARVSATTGLIGTSANIASNLGANTLPAGIKKSLDAIGTASGMVSFVTGAGSFVKYYQSASKTISNAKLGNIQTASESLQDELYTAIQHSDELGISPTEIEKYQVALRELDNNYAKVFGKAYVPKLVGKVLQGAGNVTNVFFKNVDEFAQTFDKAGNVSQAIRNQAFDLYKQGKWSELETLFKNNNLNGKWPPANGGFNIIDDVDLKAGMKFDRYGGALGNYNGTGTPNLGGSFTSPMPNGTTYSFGQRALNQAENAYDFYYEIEILNDLPFKGQTGDIIPWFNQVGGGKQTMWKIPIDPATGYPKTWNKLAQEGHVKITIKSSPSGKYNNLAGTVIQ
ncbi:MAG: glycohydrolase toxin TNT-related protein [Cytophagales bacterium]